ncbi:MAG: polysaccharide export protein [Bacteroides sp.]|nr:polysaccharide export protein [Bacteroides sp.]MDE7462634.1 polysaccharide biosynthesis/export family protein [Muribaculaceae bacterium]
MKIKKASIYAATLALAMGFMTSCKTPQNVAYFQDANSVMTIETQARQAIRIQPDDKLQIIVHSKDPQLAMLFNLPVVTNRIGQSTTGFGTTALGSGANNAEGLASYTVNSHGDIDFPVLGSLHVAGMTREELAGYIKGELIGRDLIKDPTVNVEFINTGISVLGEVKTPGRYVVNRDEITILDAIALAGDLNIQGQRENVKILRNEDGKMTVYTVDLTNTKDLYRNPGFYLRQDDVVYVEPNNLRKRDTTVNGNSSLSASFWLSVVSMLTSVAVLVSNLVKK